MKTRSMKMRTAVSVAVIIAAAAFAGCSGCCKEKRYSVKTFTSKQELVERIVPLFNAGDSDAIHKTLIQKDFYIDKIYPNTAEGRSPGHMSGENFWSSIINLKRPYNIKENIEKYKGRILSIEHIGEPRHVMEFGPYKYLRHVKLTLKVKDKTGAVVTITDDDLIGIVILDTESGKFMFMNTFK